MHDVTTWRGRKLWASVVCRKQPRRPATASVSLPAIHHVTNALCHVAGDGVGFTGEYQLAVGVALSQKFGVPRLHIGDLTEREAAFGDFQFVGGLVVARGVVKEFGGAEGDDEFAGIGFVSEQGAGEACGDIGTLVDDFPLGGEGGGLAASASSCGRNSAR